MISITFFQRNLAGEYGLILKRVYAHVRIRGHRLEYKTHQSQKVWSIAAEYWEQKNAWFVDGQPSFFDGFEITLS